MTKEINEFEEQDTPKQSKENNATSKQSEPLSDTAELARNILAMYAAFPLPSREKRNEINTEIRKLAQRPDFNSAVDTGTLMEILKKLTDDGVLTMLINAAAPRDWSQESIEIMEQLMDAIRWHNYGIDLSLFTTASIVSLATVGPAFSALLTELANPNRATLNLTVPQLQELLDVLNGSCSTDILNSILEKLSLDEARNIEPTSYCWIEKRLVEFKIKRELQNHQQLATTDLAKTIADLKEVSPQFKKDHEALCKQAIQNLLERTDPIEITEPLEFRDLMETIDDFSDSSSDNSSLIATKLNTSQIIDILTLSQDGQQQTKSHLVAILKTRPDDLKKLEADDIIKLLSSTIFLKDLEDLRLDLSKLDETQIIKAIDALQGVEFEDRLKKLDLTKIKSSTLVETINRTPSLYKKDVLTKILTDREDLNNELRTTPTSPILSVLLSTNNHDAAVKLVEVLLQRKDLSSGDRVNIVLESPLYVLNQSLDKLDLNFVEITNCLSKTNSTDRIQALFARIHDADFKTATAYQVDTIILNAPDLSKILSKLNVVQIIDNLESSPNIHILDFLVTQDLRGLKVGQLRVIMKATVSLHHQHSPIFLKQFSTEKLVSAVVRFNKEQTKGANVSAAKKCMQKLIAELAQRDDLDKINEGHKLIIIKNAPDDIFDNLLAKMGLKLSDIKTPDIIEILGNSPGPEKITVVIEAITRTDLTSKAKFNILNFDSLNQIGLLVPQFELSPSDIFKNFNSLKHTLFIDEIIPDPEKLTGVEIIAFLPSIDDIDSFIATLSPDQIIDGILSGYFSFDPSVRMLSKRLNPEALTIAQQIAVYEYITQPLSTKNELIEQLQPEDFKLATPVQKVKIMASLLDDHPKLEAFLAVSSAVDIVLMLPNTNREDILYARLLGMDLSDLPVEQKIILVRSVTQSQFRLLTMNLSNLPVEQKITLVQSVAPFQLKLLIEKGLNLEGLDTSTIASLARTISIEILLSTLSLSSITKDLVTALFNDEHYVQRRAALKTFLEKHKSDLNPYQQKLLAIFTHDEELKKQAQKEDKVPLFSHADTQSAIYKFQKLVSSTEEFLQAHPNKIKDHIPHNLHLVWAIRLNLDTPDKLIEEFEFQTEGGYLKFIFPNVDIYEFNKEGDKWGKIIWVSKPLSEIPDAIKQEFTDHGIVMHSLYELLDEASTLSAQDKVPLRYLLDRWNDDDDPTPFSIRLAEFVDSARVFAVDGLYVDGNYGLEPESKKVQTVTEIIDRSHFLGAAAKTEGSSMRLENSIFGTTANNTYIRQLREELYSSIVPGGNNYGLIHDGHENLVQTVVSSSGPRRETVACVHATEKSESKDFVAAFIGHCALYQHGNPSFDGCNLHEEEILGRDRHTYGCSWFGKPSESDES